MLEKRTSTPKLLGSLDVRSLECRHMEDYSEILVRSARKAKPEVMVVVWPLTGVSAADMAEYICSVLNNERRDQELLADAASALKLCLEEDRMTFTSEQCAESVVARLTARLAA